MQASVVVVNWRQPELTLRCLDALAGQTSRDSFEVVLVENEAGPDATDAFTAAHPRTVVVEEPTNAGFAGGVARGIAAASGEVIVLVNNDAVPDTGFIEAGLAALASAGPRVAAVSAAVILEGRFVRDDDATTQTLVGLDGSQWRRTAAEGEGIRLLNGTGIEMTPDGNGYDRDWLTPFDDVVPSRGDPFGFSGGAAFIRRDALTEVGGFDESLFMYYEDLDVSWRLRLAGYTVGFAPAATIVHRHAGSSSSGSELLRRQSMRNRLAVVLRNGSAGLVIRVVARTLVRLSRDLLRPGDAYLSRRAWARIASDIPWLVVGAVKKRATATRVTSRRAVERLLQ